MPKLPFVHQLSRRERQIIDVLYRAKRATVSEVRAELPSPPSYSAVRATMRILEEKGHVRHIVDGPRYVYEPVTPRDTERQSALQHVVRTFFDGSREDAMVALIDSAGGRLTKKTLDELAKRIAQARREGR
jgi:BlaI family transcriptional regulator, penicillinase repressor